MAPESIKEETAKQVSTTDKMNKVEEELSEEHKVEEEDDGGSDIDRRYKYVPRPEPEWDVDSYDGRDYESDPEDRQLFSDEEDYQEYSIRKRQGFASKGFIPEPSCGIYPIKLDEIVYNNMTDREMMTNLANFCVKKSNDEKGKTVELVEIVRATMSGGLWNYCITFMAREYPNGPLVEYQAKVMDYPGNEKHPFPILCRPSPKLSIV